MALHADVTARLQYSLHRARLRQRGRRKNRKSYLFRKERRVYKSLSVENLRVKTFGLIPDERAVAGQKEAWWCVVAKVFAGLSVSLLPPLTTLGTVDIYALRGRDSSPACQPILLTFCQILYSAYDVLYLVVLLVWFCSTSCEPIVRGHANLPVAPHPAPKLSPQFDDNFKHPPGWAWLCWLRGGACLVYMFLAIPMLEIGIIYLYLCSSRPAVPGWLLGEGAVTVACMVTLFPMYCMPLQLGTRTLTSFHLVAFFLAAVMVVWPPLGLLTVLAGWRERREISSSTSGYCDPQFQLFTVVVAATLSFPVACCLYATFLLILAVGIVGIGTLLFWRCCDEGFGPDIGVVTYTYGKSPLFDTEVNNTGSGDEEYDSAALNMGSLPTEESMFNSSGRSEAGYDLSVMI